MNQFENNNFSLLNEEKKNQIMKDLRKEIDQHKARYSQSHDQFSDLYDNNSYNANNSNNVKPGNNLTYQINDEINNNLLEQRDSNKLKNSEDDDEEEEHLEILNNAKNVLNQIQDDINKFSKVYGIQNILRNNGNISDNNNPISEPVSNINKNNNINNESNSDNLNNNNDNYEDNENDNINYDDNNNYDDNDNYEDDNKNNDGNNEQNNDENDNENYIGNYDNNKYENGKKNINENNYIEYGNHYKNENLEEKNNIEDNKLIGQKNNNTSIKMNSEIYKYNNDQSNTLFQQKISSISDYNNRDDEDNLNYNNILDEEQPRKYEYINNYRNNSNINNNINDSMPSQNSSKTKYNFDNPLNYDKTSMKINFKKYSNYSNYINQNISLQEEQGIISNDINQKRKTKSTTKQKIKPNNNNLKSINRNEYINKITKTNNPRYKNLANNNINVSTDNIFAIKNKEKFESMKKELEDKFAEDHPFRPKINKKYNNKINKNDETEEERYNRLSRPKILDINEKKRQKDLEELKKISENNKYKTKNKINPKEVSIRLYNTHQQMKMKKDKIKQNYEENQNKEYSFTPEINHNSKLLMNKYQNKPIYERNEEFEKQKTDNIIRMRLEIEKEQKERCKPLINENSRKIALMNRNNNNKNDYGEQYEDVYERLYKENINKDIKSLENREMKECTFTPKLNPVSNYLINNNYSESNFTNEDNLDYNDNLKDFLERQKMYEDLKKEKLEKNKKNNKSNYTFKPEINSNSNLLVKCNPERFGEKDEDKYSRLYQDAQRIKIKKEKMENELNNKYDFFPKINELSKYIGRKPGIEELNYIQENKEMNKKNKQEEEYDFKPQMFNNNKYKNIQSNYKNDQNMLERINEEVQNKDKKIKMMQKLRENKDIEQCNFTPEINKEIPDFENNKPMYMKGMARYLNQMEKARQAKRDKEQREKEVFLTGEGWSKNNGVTVPKPFKLSYQNSQKMKNSKKERENEEKKECYFKPKTNESKNREIIKKLLNEN